MLASEIIGATLPGIALIDGKRGLSLCLDCELEFFDVALLVAVERVLRNDASTMDSPGLLALPAASAIEARWRVCKSVTPNNFANRARRYRHRNLHMIVKNDAHIYISDAGSPGNRVARGGTQGGLNCPTHALPRCLPTPTEEADGNGYGVIAGRGGPRGRRPEQALT